MDKRDFAVAGSFAFVIVVDVISGVTAVIVPAVFLIDKTVAAAVMLVSSRIVVQFGTPEVRMAVISASAGNRKQFFFIQ